MVAVIVVAGRLLHCCLSDNTTLEALLSSRCRGKSQHSVLEPGCRALGFRVWGGRFVRLLWGVWSRIEGLECGVGGFWVPGSTVYDFLV